MKLNEFLININNNQKACDRYVNSKRGKEFEERIISVLTTGDDCYLALPMIAIKDNKDDIEEFKKMKRELHEYKSIKKFSYSFLKKYSKSPKLIYQPFGTQNSPDLLLIKDGNVLPVEIKFTDKSSKKPMWNSGLPRDGYLYIFGSYGKKDITFFFNPNNLNSDEGSALRKIVETKRKELSNEGLNITSKFEIYLRPEFRQINNVWLDIERLKKQNEAIQLTENF